MARTNTVLLLKSSYPYTENVYPSITAQKIYYSTEDKNLTELSIVNTELSNAGIRAPLYWFHDEGYFEEFLGHKKG